MTQKYKAITPIIATVLLIVIAVILVTIFLSFGKDITTKSLDKANDIKDLSSSDAENFVYPKNFSQGAIQFNYNPPATLVTENIVITGYKIFTDDNETITIDLDTNYTLVNGQNIIILADFSGLNITDKEMNIQFVTADNQYIMLKNITNPVVAENIVEEEPEQVATPSADLIENTYTSIQSVTLSTTTPDSNIYYTIDGNSPTQLSTLYTGAISIATTTTLKAKAYKTGWADSNVFTAVYTINLPLELPWVMDGAVKLYIHPTDNSTNVTWGCYETSIGANARSSTDGEANTAAIVVGCTARPIAASVCEGLTAYGYSDWYLPANNQLSEIWYSCQGTPSTACMNAAINKGGYLASWVDIVGTIYYSSTEISSYTGYYIQMNSGSFGAYNKYYGAYVRCVRSDP